MQRLSATASARSLAWMSRDASFRALVPPLRTQLAGAALAASVSRADELEAPISYGRGIEAAFSR